jgi:hypothetical protein
VEEKLLCSTIDASLNNLAAFIRRNLDEGVDVSLVRPVDTFAAPLASV